jgi:hypothetical protein
VPALALLALVCGLLVGPDVRSSIAAPDHIRFSELYGSFSPLGLSFSEVALRLRGKAVAMRGYMAPPLKPDATFFVLTSQPVALCPFCQSDADWPQDIAVVYLRKGETVPFRTSSDLVEVWGVLELGSKTDPATGFVSQVRVVEATARRVSPAGV